MTEFKDNETLNDQLVSFSGVSEAVNHTVNLLLQIVARIAPEQTAIMIKQLEKELGKFKKDPDIDETAKASYEHMMSHYIKMLKKS